MTELKLFLVGLAYVDASILVVGGILVALVMMFELKWFDNDIANRIMLPVIAMIFMHLCACVLAFVVSWLLA